MKAGSVRILGVLVLCLLFSAVTYANPLITFGALPAGGSISGPAGSTVGWGYSVSNGSLTDWLVFTNLTTDTLFAFGTPNAFVFDFPIVAPGSSLSVPYNGISGLFEFTWDGNAPVGFTNSGNFVLSAEWWDGDPFNGGNFLSGISDFTVAYSVTVDPATTPAPEPSSIVLLGCGLGALILKNRRRN